MVSLAVLLAISGCTSGVGDGEETRAAETGSVPPASELVPLAEVVTLLSDPDLVPEPFAEDVSRCPQDPGCDGSVDEVSVSAVAPIAGSTQTADLAVSVVVAASTAEATTLTQETTGALMQYDGDYRIAAADGVAGQAGSGSFAVATTERWFGGDLRMSFIQLDGAGQEVGVELMSTTSVRSACNLVVTVAILAPADSFPTMTEAASPIWDDVMLGLHALLPESC